MIDRLTPPEREAYARWLADSYAPALRKMDSDGAHAAGYAAGYAAGAAAERAAERERWHAAALLAFDALALDAGSEQAQREADALRELGALLRSQP